MKLMPGFTAAFRFIQLTAIITITKQTPTFRWTAISDYYLSAITYSYSDTMIWAIRILAPTTSIGRQRQRDWNRGYRTLGTLQEHHKPDLTISSVYYRIYTLGNRPCSDSHANVGNVSLHPCWRNPTYRSKWKCGYADQRRYMNHQLWRPHNKQCRTCRLDHA